MSSPCYGSNTRIDPGVRESECKCPYNSAMKQANAILKIETEVIKQKCV